MATEKYLTYRGDIKAAIGIGGTVVFVTVHPENLPTAVYRLNADTLTLDEDALPAGGVALVADGDSVWVAGTDAVLYECPAKGGKPKPRGGSLPAVAYLLALLSDDRLAALAGSEVVILARKDGKVLQKLPLPDTGTSLSADPTGKWLVAGTAKGRVSVFECEDKSEFLVSESEKLHDGAVTALLFEPEELRFFSAGADQKLLSTLARGKLEPEDKGRGNNHTNAVSGMVWGPGDRLLTASRDKTVKSWPRIGFVKPSTLAEGLGSVVDLACVQVHTRTNLVAACNDNSLRLVPLDPAGKFGEVSHQVYGYLDWAQHELAESESSRRESALKALAEVGDAAAIVTISNQVGKDSDPDVRLLATQLLGSSKNPRAAKLLEPWITHESEAVRRAALEGLRKQRGEKDLHPLDLALQAGHPDVGTMAVAALETLAKKDDQALTRLLDALNAESADVRQAALASLEKVYPAKSPEASLMALNSPHSDLRRLALVRLFQREMLDNSTARAAIRRRCEDDDADVRHMASLILLHTRPKLVKVLRDRDSDLNRQIVDLENFGQEQAGANKESKKKEEKKEDAAAKEKPGKKEKLDLNEAEFEPLLQAAASRSVDTCLVGARGLAVLGDPRAFGILLQLSREAEPAVRVGVCKALAALDDPRSIERLRSLLYDEDEAVRDAAFTALSHLHDADPLLCAESGLNAAFEDVRRRGLQTLISHIRKAVPKQASEPGWQLLVRALNDSFDSVRAEAFKASLNLKIGGGGIQTSRFVLQSVHAHIRREVLTEVMAQAGEEWAWNLLLEFFNDADEGLRHEAFNFATKKTKELAPLEVALGSQYADTRLLAVDGLVNRHSQAAQAILARALTDADASVRLKALSALSDDDAQAQLLPALNSPHADIRIGAATAVARHGNKAALPPLLAIVSAELPMQKSQRKEWAGRVKGALHGLCELADPAALPHIFPQLKSKSAAIRKEAARALLTSAIPNHLESLVQAMHHSDPEVKYRAALGLAYSGDASNGSLVFSEEAAGVLTVDQRVLAAFALGAAGEDRLAAFLDDNHEPTRNMALVLLLLRELKMHGGSPRRILACLASRMPRVRLSAASALESFADPKALLQVATQVVNDRDEDQPWKIPSETVDMLAELVTAGNVRLRLTAAMLFRNLSQKEQAPFNGDWKILQSRYAAEIKSARELVTGRKATPSQFTPVQLRELAFGAYVGLIREQGGAPAVRVRQTALSRALALAKADKAYSAACIPVFVQALGDPNQAVRTQAFEQLQQLEMDPLALGGEAIESGQTDLGIKGLELLNQSASGAKGLSLLEEIMMSRKDELAIKAGEMLAEKRAEAAVAAKLPTSGKMDEKRQSLILQIVAEEAIPVAVAALESPHPPVREWAVSRLAALMTYSTERNLQGTYQKAQECLREAVQSRFQSVRESAALKLARKKDTAAFDALVKLLATQDEARQRQAIEALVQVGDPRTPEVFLDRLENDPSGTAMADDLLTAAGNFRRVENVDRLLRLMDKEQFRIAAFKAVYTISGFVQKIDDPEDENPDRSWEKKQYPRQDAVLARLLDRSLTLNNPPMLKQLIPEARWARGKDADGSLGQLVSHPDDDIRHAAIEAVGWRLRKRQGLAEPLLKALSHRDPVSQFLAAEGLARGGKSQGLSVLLSAVELMADLNLRRRAVLALGELADNRALDVLLRIASEDGHALQDAAAEAIGHLGKSEKAEQIFQLLERYAKGQGSVAQTAIRGLRWFNTVAGWQLIRKRAADPGCYFRQSIVELLGHNDDPATRDLLLKILVENEDLDIVRTAWRSAGRLFGEGALEIDYAWLQNPEAENAEEGDSLRRLHEKGDPRRILEILPKCPPGIQDALATTLLNRPNPPVAEAQTVLGGNDPVSVRLAAQIIGRAGASAGKAAGPAITNALSQWQKKWEQDRKQMAQSGEEDGALTGQLTPCIESILWAAGRLGVASDAMLEAATAHPDDPHYRPIRLAAISAMASGKLTEAVVKSLETVAVGNDAEIRTLAAEVIANHSAKRASELAAKEQLLSDRASFNRLASKPDVKMEATLRAAVGQLHYQGVVLPHLISRRDIDGLAAVLENTKLPEATRLGAIEGLAMLADEKAEAKILAVAQVKKEELDLRKAAWRALRRSKRARQKAKKTEVKAS